MLALMDAVNPYFKGQFFADRDFPSCDADELSSRNSKLSGLIRRTRMSESPTMDFFGEANAASSSPGSRNNQGGLVAASGSERASLTPKRLKTIRVSVSRRINFFIISILKTTAFFLQDYINNKIWRIVKRFDFSVILFIISHSKIIILQPGFA